MTIGYRADVMVLGEDMSGGIRGVELGVWVFSVVLVNKCLI